MVTPRSLPYYSVPSPTAVAAFDKLRDTLVALAAFSLLLSIAGSFAIALGITRPLSELVRRQSGSRKATTPPKWQCARRDEIGLLASSLDQMRTGIAEREREILRLAYRDTLTGLPNRALFNERLVAAIEKSRLATEPLTILVMDLDRFKYVNDTLGHEVGDHVLKEVASQAAATAAFFGHRGATRGRRVCGTAAGGEPGRTRCALRRRYSAASKSRLRSKSSRSMSARASALPTFRCMVRMRAR